MVEWMDNVEMAIQKVCASKVYTSAEFKREKDNFHVIIFSKMQCPILLILLFVSLCAKISNEPKQKSG